MQKVLLLPGDGLGPTLIDCAEQIISVATEQVEIVRGDIGFDAYERTGEYLPLETVELIKECGSAICGPLNTYKDGFGKPVNITDSLRKNLDLYATVRPFKTLSDRLGHPGLCTSLWGSNTSRAFDVSEVRNVDGISLSKYISTSTYTRMMTRALTFLEQSGRTKVESITRDDLFPDSSGLFDETFDTVFDPEVYQLSHSNIQTWASKVVRDPSEYEFLICADLYVNVAAGILAGMAGGNHLFPIGYVGDTIALMIPGLMTTFDGVTKDDLNPTSIIFASSMALMNIGMTKEAGSIVDALCQTYADWNVTPDLGGTLSAHEFTDIVASNL